MHSSATERITDDNALWLLHITDNHLFADIASSGHGVNSHDSLRRVLETATRERQPDLVVNTGDIANDSTIEVYESFVEILNEYVDCSLIATPGNHDASAPFRQVLKSEPISMKGWRVVGVDTHVEGKVHGEVTPDELDKLACELTADRSPTLVFGHHPATEIDCRWIDPHRISNGRELISKLHEFPHVRAFLSGHVHQQFDAQEAGLQLMTTPSTCWQFKPRSVQFEIDDAAPGWRWLALQPDGTINSVVERLDAAV